MANELTRQDAPQKPQRDIAVVTSEINELYSEAQIVLGRYCIEIGRRVYEAKQIVPHGEWSLYIKNNLGFSQRKAEKLIQIFEGYADTQMTLFGAEIKSPALANLNMTKLVSLLALPEAEREDFAVEVDAEHISTRELDRLIKERDEAKKAAAELEERMNALKDELEEAYNEAAENEKKAFSLSAEKNTLARELSELDGKLTKAKEAEKKAKAKLKELKDNPEIPPEKIAELRADIEKENAENNAKAIEEQLSSIKAKLEAAEQAEIEARREAENAENKIADLEKRIKIADPAVAEFRTLFNHIQDYISEAKQAIGNIKDTATADGFRRAMKSLAAEIGEGL